jgi:hypothetical protein
MCVAIRSVGLANYIKNILVLCLVRTSQFNRDIPCITYYSRQFTLMIRERDGALLVANFGSDADYPSMLCDGSEPGQDSVKLGKVKREH